MEPVAISWLVASSSSPLIAVLALWTVYVFHTYRRRWRTVDLFLLAVTSQELVTSIFAFCYAIISLINPPFRAPCSFTQWGLIATRTFQIATLTSMVVDRALTVRWPYRYRFSVRRNQIRYHIAALALVSVLVGVAAIFARVPGEDLRCHLHPAQWDVRYIVFLLSLYGVLVLVSLVCMIQVEIHRSRHGTKLGANGSFQLPECASPELPSATGMNSPLDTQSSTGSTRALHRPSRQASRRPYGKNSKGTSDLRWPSVALSALLCFSLNHVPHLVLMSLATWNAYLWSPWHEAILAWLRLLEGLFVPLLLFCKDHALRSALRRTFQRRSGALSPLVGDDGPFQMYFDKDHFRKRGTFGSVTPIGIITNYRRTPGKKRRSRKGSGKYTLPGLHNGDSVLAKSCFSAGFLAAEPLSKLSCADLTSLEMWREEDEENFYATLSDDFSTFSCKSADDSALSEDIRISEELYGGSFTTIANDDFEFHDTRPCGGEVKMKPALTSTPPKNNSFNGGFSRNVSFKDNVQRKEDLSYDKRRDLFDFSGRQDDLDQKDPSIFSSTSDNWKHKDSSYSSYSPPSEMQQTPPRDTSNKFGTMSRHQKTTSFSMNDLDLIHQGGIPGKDFETTFMLPVKSESTMSLYRLNVERDLDQMILTPSKSETNVNGDSGFGSGAQSTNPVWSGFLCRKPSDPFWNIRKPTTHSAAAVTPTRNYPGILHPRMRKIPWISAWKKLDENSDLNSRRQVADSQLKDNAVYNTNSEINPHDKHVSTIDEELSDVSSPLFQGDYNMNIFAKESGVLLENAYGKIVRDDCGVKVNFYGENVQYENKECTYVNKNTPDVLFESGYEPTRASDHNDPHFYSASNSRMLESHYQPLNVNRSESARSNYKDPPLYSARPLMVENMFRSDNNVHSSDMYKCELRLNGGHYENLFGTKENIFAQCDEYIDRSKLELSHKNGKVERNSGSGKDSSLQKPQPDSTFLQTEAESVYGQLKKAERKESFNRKREELPEMQTKDLYRKESDSRGNKCGIKRRESKNRHDGRKVENPAPRIKEQCLSSGFTEFDNKTRNQEGCDNGKIEIEMKSVYGRNDLNYNNRMNKGETSEDVRCNLNRRESQTRRMRDNSNEQKPPKFDNYNHQDIPKAQENERKSKVERRESQNRKESSRERSSRPTYPEAKDNLWQPNVERKDSGRCANVERRCANVDRRDSGRCANVDRKDSGRCANVDRKDSGHCANVERRSSNRQSNERKDSGCQTNVERRESARQENNPRLQKEEFSKHGVFRRDSQNRNCEAKNEGLWVNAIPFHAQDSNYDAEEENGNAVRRESRKEAYDLHRSPRKNNLMRKESRNRNDKSSGDHVKRKVSGSRSKKERYGFEPPEGVDVANRNARKEGPGRPKDTRRNNDGGNLEDFIKYRDKCEDNFSHIQNLNRETSAERETAKMDQLISYGRLNGNLSQEGEEFTFDTFLDQRRPQFVAKPVYDVNENCRQKKLAITDFL